MPWIEKRLKRREEFIALSEDAPSGDLKEVIKKEAFAPKAKETMWVKKT